MLGWRWWFDDVSRIRSLGRVHVSHICLTGGDGWTPSEGSDILTSKLPLFLLPCLLPLFLTLNPPFACISPLSPFIIHPSILAGTYMEFGSFKRHVIEPFILSQADHEEACTVPLSHEGSLPLPINLSGASADE